MLKATLRTVIALAMLALLVMVTAPSGLMASLVRWLGIQELVLVATEGTFWSGRGSLFIGRPPSVAWESVPVSWSISPWRLLTGKAVLTVAVNDKLIQAELRPAGWSVTTDAIALPLRILRPFLPGPVASYGWSGDVHLAANRFGAKWAGMAWDGVATVRLEQLAIRELSGGSLGSFVIKLSGSDGGGKFTADGNEGRLALAVSGGWEGERIVCMGRTSIRGSDSPELEKLLAVLLPATASGERLIDCAAFQGGFAALRSPAR